MAELLDDPKFSTLGRLGRVVPLAFERSELVRGSGRGGFCCELLPVVDFHDFRMDLRTPNFSFSGGGAEGGDGGRA